ncbi:AAA family ATPase [Tessaracoccus caeni]|uniref:AAA family ATPase n=1 Tax=Tessaracoccus caeni TaxID=3031239 RepID=UPI0023D9F096|nr:AAA family ATPase [Tessaracoccus caeni]MDF1486763.1 AAA family ATPase [Tessaracoccus caeni]
MTPPRLGRLHFSGLTSLRDVELELATDVTVLIGANGSGKSNLVTALELLSRILDGQLQDTLLQRGGFGRHLHVAPKPADDAERISLIVWSDQDADGVYNGYRAELESTVDDAPVLRETVFPRSAVKPPKGPSGETFGRSRESVLSITQSNERLEHFLGTVRPLLDGIRVYHFDDVGATAPTKKWHSVDDDVILHADAGNLAPYLLRLKSEHPGAYQRIVTVIRNVAPFFDDFVLKPNSSEQIRLRWRQRGISDRVFSASELSDGTLRFACLATLLLSPDAPRVIVLDEPELGLHPFAITQLAALIRQATVRGRQAIVATQSALLLDEFPLESVALLDRKDGATTVSRPDPAALEAFVDEYSLSDLWQMNILHTGTSLGRPCPARVGDLGDRRDRHWSNVRRELCGERGPNRHQ